MHARSRAADEHETTRRLRCSVRPLDACRQGCCTQGRSAFGHGPSGRRRGAMDTALGPWTRLPLSTDGVASQCRRDELAPPPRCQQRSRFRTPPRLRLHAICTPSRRARSAGAGRVDCRGRCELSGLCHGSGAPRTSTALCAQQWRCRLGAARAPVLQPPAQPAAPSADAQPRATPHRGRCRWVAERSGGHPPTRLRTRRRSRRNLRLCALGAASAARRCTPVAHRGSRARPPARRAKLLARRWPRRRPRRRWR